MTAEKDNEHKSMEEQVSPTWVLFKSGNSSTVTASIYSAANASSRPVDAYIVTECEGEFTKAARRAADIVYHYFAKRYNTTPLVVGYDLQHASGAEKTITGGSGGLSFAIALAKQLLPDHQQRPGPVAATGELGSNGQVIKITGFKAKVEAALTVLPKNGWFFFPKDNSSDLTESLLTQLKNKKIHYRAVSHVSQAFDILLDKREPVSLNESKRPLINILFPALIITAIVIVGGYSLYKANSIPKRPDSKTTARPSSTRAQQGSSSTDQPLESHIRAKENAPKELSSEKNNIPDISAAPETKKRRRNSIQVATPSAATIVFQHKTELENKFVEKLTYALRQYMQENGITGTGVTISGTIIINKTLGPNIEDRKTDIELRKFIISKLGTNKVLPNLQLAVDGTPNETILSLDTVNRLLSKITQTSDLQNSDSKYWTKIKDFSFTPLSNTD